MLEREMLKATKCVWVKSFVEALILKHGIWTKNYVGV